MNPSVRHSFSIENILTKCVNFGVFSEQEFANKSPQQFSPSFLFSPLPPHHFLGRCFDKVPTFVLQPPPKAFPTEFSNAFFERNNGEREVVSEAITLFRDAHFLGGNAAHSKDSERRGTTANGSGRRVGHPYERRRVPAAQKKLRTSFSKAQIAILERRFSEQKYLASSERTPLAIELRMEDAQVKTWFQNRRTKWRRQEAEERAFEHKTMKKSLSDNANLKLISD
ncbi:hypothetical protein niasHS_015937 [Heterodera schachtii]|uniref:Homeobox domain-containing protein n=1 Tax=Heterodera schachtii TaxID=97005 RepID=A0ABD2HTU7_HETSC